MRLPRVVKKRWKADAARWCSGPASSFQWSRSLELLRRRRTDGVWEIVMNLSRPPRCP